MVEIYFVKFDYDYVEVYECDFYIIKSVEIFNFKVKIKNFEFEFVKLREENYMFKRKFVM